jgi:hypothetical protein
VRSTLSVTVAAAALVAAAAFTGVAAADAKTPALSALSRYVAFKDSTLYHARRAGDLPDTWPFSELTATGETVRIHLSKRLYATPDATVAQQWADFFDTLVHGPELATLDAYLLTLSQVQAVCGEGALACYGRNEIIAPAEDPAFDLSAESVVAHEYGHHVAAHRINTPWEAIDYGTKRWATYENVCSKTRKGVYYPGDESEERYFYNPGEGFAEAYRVLNERHLGLHEAPWDIVTNALYPDDNALALLEQDVTAPWTKNTTLTRAGSISASAKSRAFVISTPLDGRLSVRLTSSAAKAKFRLDVLSPNAKSLAGASGKNKTVSTAICGERALRVRVNRLSGAGVFKLSISRP